MAAQKHAVYSRQFKRGLLLLGITLIYSLPVAIAYAADVTLAWDANSEPDLQGYRVYCGESSGNYAVSQDIKNSNPGDLPPTTCAFTGLDEGKKYYFAAVAYSDKGQSGYSQEISHTIPVNPNDSDDDGDGYTENTGDCDDANAAVHPGANEVCGDGIDQNCDGSDAVCPGDIDNDDDGFSRNAGDCNDADAAVYPGAVEICGDGIDQNCDGSDAVCPGDIDNDGDGFSRNAGDCNDADAAVYPGAVEICGDGIDQDCNGSDLTCVSVDSELPIEFGEIAVGHDWKKVALNRVFNNPVVIAGAVGYAEPDPAVTRVKDVTGNGFEVRVQEWDYLNLNGHYGHASEQASYMVIETGAHELPNGTHIEAGRFDAKAVTSFASIKFRRAFNTVPVVLTTISSDTEGDAVTIRLKNITTTGFSYLVQEQEANAKQHVSEAAGYIAWEPSAGSMKDFVFEVGRTSNSVTHKFQTVPFDASFSLPPVFLAGMQTTDGSDTAAVRWQKRQVEGIQVKIEEEQSKDTETNHTTEVIGYMAFEAVNPTQNDTAPAYVLAQEAEEGNLYGAFRISSDPAASGGGYVHVPNGTGSRLNGPDENHKMMFTFEIPGGGTYRIKAAVHAANGNDDSFWVKVNDGPAGGYLWDTSQNTGYQQDYVNARHGADPVEVSFADGENTVTVYLREDGTRLDKIELEPVDTPR